MTMHEIFRDRPSHEDRVTVEAERLLIEQAQSGAHYAPAAQWDLIRQYRGLLYATAGKVRARIPGMTPEQVDDLESDLVLAALDAIQDFDLEKHIRLSHTLPTVLNRVATSRTDALSIPRQMLDRWSKILRLADGDLAKAAEDAPKSGMASETFRAIHHALDYDDEEWAEVPYSPADKAAPDELTHALVHRALDTLKPSQREVVELAYGFRGDPKSDAEVAEIVGAPSRKTVETRRTSALAKMRAELNGAEQ
jgi:RNA polymerase sigma factor (sigma-70 family)